MDKYNPSTLKSFNLDVQEAQSCSFLATLQEKRTFPGEVKKPH